MFSARGAVRSMKEWMDFGIGYLESRNVADAKTDAWLLMEYAANIDKNYYYMNMHSPMDAGDAEDYYILLERRGEHIPVQYLTGEAWFYGYPFRVNSHVLIPRQDTEILVEEALKLLNPGDHILDLCTGSGCILLTLIKKAKVTGVGTDLSPEALVVAELNRKLLHVNANWICSDLFEHVGGRFQMIVSNPPYIPTKDIEMLDAEVKDHEPRMALDGDADGLEFYRRIIAGAGSYLTDGGYLLLEVGYNQGPDVSAMMERHGFTNVRVTKDLSGLDRVVTGQLELLQ